MQELYPAIVAEQSEGKGSQDQECELEAEEVEEEDGNALPVQQIMSSDMESPKMPGGSKSATEVLMSLEPYHSQSNGSHEDQGYQQNSQQAQAGPIEGVPLPHPHAIIDSLPLRHPFNTADFVAALEAAGHSRPVAEAFMRATKHLLISEEEHSLANLVGKQDLENQAYLFRAALDELQTEVQVQCRNDAIALRSANGQLQREIDAVTQKLREDIHDLKNEYVSCLVPPD